MYWHIYRIVAIWMMRVDFMCMTNKFLNKRWGINDTKDKNICHEFSY
jgi:hypothetical protein